MWSESEFKAKAQKYFARAEAAATDDEQQIIWCLLGLEFLLRAPLAKVNPVLLADPAAGGGYSALHAAGLRPAESREPISITTKTVVERLVTIAGFTSEDKTDISFLLGLRNAELHSSSSVVLNVSGASWLPKFYRVVKKLAEHLGEELIEYLSNDFIAHASRLTDEQDKRLQAEIGKRIKACSEFYARLTPQEVESRRAIKRQIPLPALVARYIRSCECPACSESGILVGEAIRYSREELRDDDTIVRRIFLAAVEYDCKVCGLELSDLREIAAAGLLQEWSMEEEESLDDRLAAYYEPDYGND